MKKKLKIVLEINKERCENMRKNNSGLMICIMAGAIAATAITMVSRPVMSNAKKMFRKQANKAMNSVNSVMDNFSK